MTGPRIRLALLWLSQTVRVVADGSLLFIAVLLVVTTARGRVAAAQYLAVAVGGIPFLLLAPLAGAVCNSLPRRRVLAGSALFPLLVLPACALLEVPWRIFLGLVAVGAATYRAALYAVLPAASFDARIPLPRVVGWMEAGTAAGLVGASLLGWHLAGPVGAGRPLPPSAWGILIVLNLICLLAAAGARFPSDAPRQEPALRAATGFFRDLGRIFSRPPAWAPLAGLACFRALVAVGFPALLAQGLPWDVTAPEPMLKGLILLGAGMAAGCLFASLQGNPRRSVGLVPFAATGLFLALAWATLTAGEGRPLPGAPCFLLGFTGGLVDLPLRVAFMAAVPADARGHAMALMNALVCGVALLLGGLLLAANSTGRLVTVPAQLALLAALAGVGTALCWWLLAVHALEQLIEVLVWPLFRIRAAGPGKDRIPQTGPLLVVANHSAYMDPFWLAKIIPRKVTPMMTSVFYDLPVIRWLMVRVVKAIRVQHSVVRREVPELREAVAVLRQGGCVLLFPEAILRRTEGQMIRPFGQGIWHILQELPQTPVVVCWIEGGWGSYFSYQGGPPLTNKRMDFWRKIAIGVEEVRVIDPALLGDREATRGYFLRAVLSCRRHLGLAVPDEPGVLDKPGVLEGDDKPTDVP